MFELLDFEQEKVGSPRRGWGISWPWMLKSGECDGPGPGESHGPILPFYWGIWVAPDIQGDKNEKI